MHRPSGAAVAAVLALMGPVSCGSGRTGSEPPGPGAAGTAGPCHARGGAPYVLPDPACTPGATNPAVTQADIGSTICRAGWTGTVRPAESYTEGLKDQQMSAYGDRGPVSSYEEDHLVPLGLGGSPTSPRNLWPEPGASPNPKDSVEAAANQAVCDGRMSLAAAQAAIAADWVALGRQLGAVGSVATTVPTGPPAPASCTVTASYSQQYGDYDVYVRSDQPNRTVNVRSSGGVSASWHTDGQGYADVYLHAGADTKGQAVTATVGGATCSTSL